MRAEESIANYFSYVKNVLGLRGVRFENKTDPSGFASREAVCDLLFIHLKTPEDQGLSTFEAKDLLDKMIQAMRLVGKTYEIYEHPVAADERVDIAALLNSLDPVRPASFVVVFSSKPGATGKIQNLGPQKYIETFSPSYLLVNANAKKVVWSDLQKVMKELGVS